MRNFLLVGYLTLFSISSVIASDFRYEAEVYDERFENFLDLTSDLETLETGFGWAEGPVWSVSLNALLFSDVSKDAVYRWSEAEGLSEYVTPSGHSSDEPIAPWRGSNGLAIDSQDRLVLAQQGGRTVGRMLAPLNDPKPEYEILAHSYKGKLLSSPNDLVVHPKGHLFFTDPPYGHEGFENNPAIELDFFGVMRLSPTGELTVVADYLEKPNGVAFSPDFKRLYVSNSEKGKERIIAVELDAAGDVQSQILFFDGSSLSQEGPGSTDGMVMHSSGMLFSSLPNGLGILSPEGKLLGKLNFGQVTNLAINSDETYLYILRPAELLRLKLKIQEPN